jgi:hypothetical protein
MGQRVIKAGFDHVMNIAGDKGDQMDAMRSYPSGQRPRNCTADQGVNVKVYQLCDLGKQIVLR